MLKLLVHYIFYGYSIVLIVRIAASWLPSLYRYRWMRWVTWATEPYLSFFQRLIPPLGGTLDLSPMLGLFILRIAEQVVLFVL